MEKAENKDRQALLFKEFYDTYGTHYITEVRTVNSSFFKASVAEMSFYTGPFRRQARRSDKVQQVRDELAVDGEGQDLQRHEPRVQLRRGTRLRGRGRVQRVQLGHLGWQREGTVTEHRHLHRV